MVDPLAEVVALLQPAPTFSKVLSGAGRWRASRTEVGQPFYCVVLEGSLRLSVNGGEIADDIVANAPATEGHFFLVPKVVE